MVSKIMKIRTNKCVAMKNHHGKSRHHHRNSSVKKAATKSKVMLAGIDKSSLECLLQTPKPTWPESAPQTTRPQLPPLTSPEKRTVFLDLDETLVHSSATVPNRFDFIVRPIIRGTKMTFYVIKRPGVDQFLQKLAEKYEVVVFTAAMREYASLVLDRLDRHGVIISHRLYRESCREVNGKFVKDLSGLGRDLRRVVIVDDSPNSYLLQPENGIPVLPFIYDMADGELGRLLKFFESEGSDQEDIRDAVREYVNDEERISDDDDEDDVDSGGSDYNDDEELEIGSGKSTVVSVLRSNNSSTPCCMISLHEYYTPEAPVAMEYRINMTPETGCFIPNATVWSDPTKKAEIGPKERPHILEVTKTNFKLLESYLSTIMFHHLRRRSIQAQE